jgi:hypothetical protein
MIPGSPTETGVDGYSGGDDDDDGQDGDVVLGSPTGRLPAGILRRLRVAIFGDPSKSKKKDDHVALHDTFVHVFFASLDDSSTMPLVVAYCSVIDGGADDRHRCAEASEVSHVFAALKYAVKAIVLLDTYKHGCGRTPEDGWKDKSRGLADEVDTGTTHVAHTMQVVTRVMRSEGTSVRFYPCRNPEHYGDGYGIIDDVETTLRSLGFHGVAGKCQAEVEHLLIKTFGNSYMPPGFVETLCTMSDSMQERAVGFSFSSHPQNVEKAMEFAMFASDKVASRLFDNGGAIRRGPVNAFRLDCSKIRENLLVLMQL